MSCYTFFVWSTCICYQTICHEKRVNALHYIPLHMTYDKRHIIYTRQGQYTYILLFFISKLPNPMPWWWNIIPTIIYNVKVTEIHYSVGRSFIIYISVPSEIFILWFAWLIWNILWFIKVAWWVIWLMNLADLTKTNHYNICDFLSPIHRSLISTDSCDQLLKPKSLTLVALSA